MNQFNQEVLFSPNECKQILQEHTTFKRSIATDTTYIKNEINKKQLNDWRTSFDSIIELSSNTKNLLLSKLKKYNIVNMDNVSTVVRYEVGQQFKKHRDSEDGYNHRYKTLVIQLSDENEYEGGELCVYDKENKIITSNKKIGNIVLFNSDLLHEAKPVLSGTRYIWITWLRSSDFNLNKGIL